VVKKPSNWLESLNCAIEGILWAARTQRNLRYHFVVSVLVVVVAMVCRVSALELIFLVFGIVLVFFAELVNTAVEVIVDLVSPEFHPLARQAKDVAAGAVLVACIGAVIIGYLALSRHLFHSVGGGFSGLGRPPGEVALFSVLTVIILVILLKSVFKSGMPLKGGMPSGHAAVAFSIATSVVFIQSSMTLSVLGFILAFIVGRSRVLLKIHSFLEVMAGAIVGVLVTIALYLIYP
jgi:diacylglycerol kinase (ATP)